MIVRRRLAVLVALAACSASEAAAKKTLELLGSFRFLSDAPLEKIQGTAEGARGVIVLDLADLTRATGEVSAPVARMKTGSPIRDEHLRGESWLDAAHHPRMRFVVRSVSGVDARQKGEIFVARGTVHGDFTLRGVTKPLSSSFTLKMKGDRAKVELAFEVALADYEVKGREGIVGKKVGERIAITGRLVGVAKETPL